MGIIKFSVPSADRLYLTILWSTNSDNWALSARSELTKNASLHVEYRSLKARPINQKQYKQKTQEKPLKYLDNIDFFHAPTDI